MQVQFSGLGAAIEYIRTGKLRALAVTAATRSQALPDVPTAGEFVTGYEGIVLLHMLGQDRHQLLARPIARLALLFDVHGRFLRRLAINAISDLLNGPALTLKRSIDKFLGNAPELALACRIIRQNLGQNDANARQIAYRRCRLGGPQDYRIGPFSMPLLLLQS